MPSFGQNLTAYQDKIRDQIKDAVTEVRLKYITDIPGQENLYDRKAEMAASYLALDPEPPTLDGFYLIEKEVGITAPTAQQLCQLWLNMNALWEVIGGDLEAVRMTANNAVAASLTRSDVDQAFQQFQTDLISTGY